jgi:ubiquinone/menaquinone biosynthesis C-methylase UbiE
MNVEIIEIKIKEAYGLLDDLIDLCKDAAVERPHIVVIVLHEYFRNIWPNDPFILNVLSDDRLENIILCLKKSITVLENTKFLGSYFSTEEDLIHMFNKVDVDENHLTQTVYGNLWKDLNDDYVNNESKNVLLNIFEKNNQNIDLIKNKSVLDMGCGSGRFTIALAQLGAKMVTGIDLGKTGINVGRKISESLHLKNIKFLEGNVTSLPFEDNSFDFVFSKGVLHHTGNLKKGLDEYHRVLKKGGNGFLYLYGSGGLFWNSRIKMREVMKLIPMNYTNNILKFLGMPSRRYIFVDSWYVPIEEHVERNQLENYLTSQNYSKIEEVQHTGSDDINSMSNQPYSKELWGDGELRYFLTK